MKDATTPKKVGMGVKVERAIMDELRALAAKGDRPLSWQVNMVLRLGLNAMKTLRQKEDV